MELLEDRTLLSSVPPPAGIVSWWAGDGNATDLVGSNAGTLNNGVTFYQGEVADGFNFNGTDDVSAGTTGLPSGKSDRTLELSFKANSFPAYGDAFFAGYGNFATTDQSYFLGTFDSILEWSAWGGVIGGPTLAPNTWYDAAVTNVGRKATLYLDGTAVGSATVPINTLANTQFYIGRAPVSEGLPEQLNGEVDEVAVYNRALSASEIQAIYQAGVDGKQKPYMVVDQSSPSEGDIVRPAPTDFTLDFSNPFATSTLQASDLTVNGIAANSVTVVDAQTATFHYATSPATLAGVQTMQMAAGVVQASGSIASPSLQAWSKTFRYDPVQLQVTSTSPASGGFVDFANPTLTVNFNEAYDPATVGTDDLVLNQGRVAGFSLTSPTSVTYTLAGVTEGSLTVGMAAGALADLQGGPMPAYSGGYQVDITTLPFTSPLAMQNPAGSLIYQGSVSGYWNPTGIATGDLDSFTLNVDANQTLTLRVTSPGQATVTVNHSVLGPLTLPADQDPLTGSLYQTIRIPTAGTLTIGVQAPSGATTGTYTVQATLNAQIYQGSDGSAPAQSLDAGMIDVEPGPVTINRAAVLGSLEAGVPRILSGTNGVNDLRGSWDQNGATTTWTVNGSGNPKTSLNQGITGTLNTTPGHSNSSDTYSFFGRAGDVLTTRSWGSSDGGGTLPATTLTLQAPGGAQTVGIAVSGATSDSMIQSLTLPSAGTYVITVGLIGTTKGTYTLTADLTTPANPRPHATDVYSLTIGAAGYLSFAAATSDQPVGQARVQLAVYAPGVDPLSGTALATSSSSGRLDAVVGYNATVPGIYKIKVTSGPGLTAGSVNYSLVAMANGSFDNTANVGFSSAEDLTGQAGALGAFRHNTSVFIPSGSGGLAESEDLVVHGGSIYVVSSLTSAVLRYDVSTGAFLSIFASGNGLNFPTGLAFGPDGNLYVSNTGSSDVLAFNGSTGVFLSTFVGAGSGGLDPYGMAFGADGNLYVASRVTNSVLRYNGTTGAFMDAFVSSGSGGLSGADDLVFGPDGNLYVVSESNDMVLRYNGSTGALIDTFVPTGGSGLNVPLAVRFGPDGDLYVANSATGSVLRYQGPASAQPGTFVDAFVPYSAAGPDFPSGLAFGPDGILYTSDYRAKDVLRTPAGDFYKVTLDAGQTVTFSTSTPGDGPGEFVNTLDPHIVLYDPSQTLVASGVALADGRNEQITYTALAAGTYYVKVSSDNGTQGEYVLDPEESRPEAATSQPKTATPLGSGPPGALGVAFFDLWSHDRKATVPSSAVSSEDRAIQRRGTTHSDLRLSALEQGFRRNSGGNIGTADALTAGESQTVAAVDAVFADWPDPLRWWKPMHKIGSPSALARASFR